MDAPRWAPRRNAPSQLDTERLRCSRFTLDHVELLGMMDRDTTVQRWLFGKTYTPAQTQARAQRRVAFWEEHGAGDYIVHTRQAVFVGFAGFFPAARPDAIAIGYALMPEHWGLGYGSELARVLTATALTLGRSEVLATILAENAASRRIVEKSGFACIGDVDGEAQTLLYRYIGG